jgi:hypothetical protein
MTEFSLKLMSKWSEEEKTHFKEIKKAKHYQEWPEDELIEEINWLFFLSKHGTKNE